MKDADPMTPVRQVPYVDFPAQWADERDEILATVEAVFQRGEFVGGPDIAELESELAAFTGTKHAVAVNSGTDALILGMKALGIGPGDEVITPPNSFVASTAAITALGATPVFADVRDDLNIDPVAVAAAVTPRTKAIMPVHLTGRIADMDPIRAIAEKHGLAVVEDAAQSAGSQYDGGMSGSLGTLGCFSAHPLKNLNAAGDAGFITTDDGPLADRIRRLRNLGLADRNTVAEFAGVSRMDTLQAAILRLRLRKLPRVIERRRNNAARYFEALDGLPLVLPTEGVREFNTFHTFVIQTESRDDLQTFLADQGIMTTIHYPIPIHLQPAAQGLGYGPGDFPVTEHQAGRILSLPINQFLGPGDLAYVADTIRRFFGG